MRASFGPALRNPNGVEEQWGAIPPYNHRVIMNAYRTGGGMEGNIGSNSITILKTTLPYVSSVTNRRPNRSRARMARRSSRFSGDPERLLDAHL